MSDKFFNKDKQIEAAEKAASTSPSSAPEVKKKVEEVKSKKEVKMIEVKTLIELPSYKGRRIPKGSVLNVPEETFNELQMVKI